MRTTVELDDALFRKAKAHAAMLGVPLKKIIEQGVELALKQTSSSRKRRIRFPLIPSCGKGKLAIPDDIAFRIQRRDDRERHEASLRR